MANRSTAAGLEPLPELSIVVIGVALDDIADASGLTGAAIVTTPSRSWERGDIDAQFVIYSIAKSVIAAAFLLLAEEGEIDLDASAATLLDDNRFGASVRQLLSHTSGLPNYGRLPEYHAAVAATPSDPWPDETFFERALTLPRDFEPGQGWAYSNTGYMALRRILAEHGGLASYLSPLGFTTARVAEELSDLDGAVPAVSAKIGDGLNPVAGRYHPAWVGHRTIVTSASELHRFWSRPPAAFLDPANLRYIGFDFPGAVRPSYGLGVQGDPESPIGLTIGHGGEGPGYSAAAVAAPTHDAVAIVLEPREDFPAQALAGELLRNATREAPAARSVNAAERALQEYRACQSITPNQRRR